MKEGGKAYLQFLSSMLIFGTIGVFRRLIPLSSGMLALWRGLIGAAVLTVFQGLHRRVPFRRRIGRIWFPAATGALIGVNWMLLFEAYERASVSAATLCYYMQPTFVMLLSPLVLKERLTARRLICAAGAVMGMVLISGILRDGGPAAGEAAGMLYALAAGAIYAFVVLLNKKVHPADNGENTAIQLFCASAILVPYLILTERADRGGFDAGTAVLVVIMGIVHTGIAYALFFSGLKGVSAQSAALMSYADPVFALILSAMVLGERLSALGILGAALIIGSAAAGEMRFSDVRLPIGTKKPRGK